jgi:hypothetical protein
MLEILTERHNLVLASFFSVRDKFSFYKPRLVTWKQQQMTDNAE